MCPFGRNVYGKMRDCRHGGPFDRGSADSYYRRKFNPHYYVGATGDSRLIKSRNMTRDQLDDYQAGYSDQTESGVFKDYGCLETEDTDD
jgi:hypothetical protein